MPYLVMQFVPGVSAQDRLDREGPLELKEILRIGMQTASALAAAHAQGLIHRDIKPANILLENGVERVKITDFGLARAVDDASLTETGVIAGTPQFMSPEQALGEPQDYRTDLFSLGSVLYALCTGRLPFRAANTLAVLRRVAEEEARPIREINPEIPRWLEDIIERLMQKHPIDRFQSAAEVAQLLEGHLAHLQQPHRIPPPAPVRKVAVPVCRRKRHHSLLLRVVLLVVFGMFLSCCLLPAAYLSLTSMRFGPPPPFSVTEMATKTATLSSNTITTHGALTCLAVNREGSKVAYGFADGNLEVYTPQTQRTYHSPAKGFLPTICAVAFTPDGREVIAAGGGHRVPGSQFREVVFLDLLTMREVRHFNWPEGLLTTMAISPNGRWLAVGGFNGVKVWEVASEMECPVPPDLGHIYCLAFSPDSSTLAAGHGKGKIQLWDPTTGKDKGVLEGKHTLVTALCFHPDGKTLVSGHGLEFMIWNVHSKQPLGGEWWPGHLNGQIRSLAYSGDGTLLALGLENDQTLLLRDSRQLCEYISPGGSCLALSPGNHLLVMGSWDGAIRFKDLRDMLGKFGGPKGPIERRGPRSRELLPPPTALPIDLPFLEPLPPPAEIPDDKDEG